MAPSPCFFRNVLLLTYKVDVERRDLAHRYTFLRRLSSGRISRGAYYSRPLHRWEKERMERTRKTDSDEQGPNF